MYSLTIFRTLKQARIPGRLNYTPPAKSAFAKPLVCLCVCVCVCERGKEIVYMRNAIKNNNNLGRSAILQNSITKEKIKYEQKMKLTSSEKECS